MHLQRLAKHTSKVPLCLCLILAVPSVSVAGLCQTIGLEVSGELNTTLPFSGTCNFMSRSNEFKGFASFFLF